ncbi:related to phosphate transport protein MIR1 [Cephalotrichum gorgonifer]|uniref:Related to phosphate transport protein MIR1 n=1 Tax=Cephalotrichum gorgonifer TaxID=2041049 RepID=A0AAE8MXL6_9PEZI|nr:related to phosphate transport protein MIR1 [Cephalotrichum gorgonifer]
MFLTRAITYTNFFVATSALGFQVFVLNPWHKELDEDLRSLKMENVRLLEGLREPPAEAAGPQKRKGGVWQAVSGLGRWGSDEISVHPSSAMADVHVTKAVVAKSWYNPEAVTLYSNGIVRGLQRATATEGIGALATGLGPTVAGYFLQGAVKFGGYEFLKGRAADYFGPETASKNRYAIYLGSSALAEMAGDLLLCPFESVRIRLVSQPGFGRGLWDGFGRIVREEGMKGLYSGLGPILLKQVPYTMAAFVVYENAIEQAYKVVDKSTASGATVTSINIGSGLIAGLASAFVSQPADTILSKINKEKGAAGEGTMRRVWNVARDTGIRGSFSGMRARLVMVGGMTAIQFAVYGDIKKAVGATGGREID